MANASYGGYAGYWLTVTPLHHPNDACGTSSDDLSSDWEPEEGRQVQKVCLWNIYLILFVVLILLKINFACILHVSGVESVMLFKILKII